MVCVIGKGETSMAEVRIGEEHDPVKAMFWGRFPTDIGHAEADCPTVALFQNPDGEFFAVEETRGPPNRKIATRPTRPIPATRAQVVNDPVEWIKEYLRFVEGCLPKPE